MAMALPKTVFVMLFMVFATTSMAEIWIFETFDSDEPAPNETTTTLVSTSTVQEDPPTTTTIVAQDLAEGDDCSTAAGSPPEACSSPLLCKTSNGTLCGSDDSTGCTCQALLGKIRVDVTADVPADAEVGTEEQTTAARAKCKELFGIEGVHKADCMVTFTDASNARRLDNAETKTITITFEVTLPRRMLQDKRTSLADMSTNDLNSHLATALGVASVSVTDISDPVLTWVQADLAEGEDCTTTSGVEPAPCEFGTTCRTSTDADCVKGMSACTCQALELPGEDNGAITVSITSMAGAMLSIVWCELL